jgi:hypothetical protein
MLYTIGVNPQNPARTKASKMLRRRLDGARGDEIVPLPVFIGVLVEGCGRHPGAQPDYISFGVFARILVRKTEQFAEKPVEVSAKSNSCCLAHFWPPFGKCITTSREQGRRGISAADG